MRVFDRVHVGPATDLRSRFPLTLAHVGEGLAEEGKADPARFVELVRARFARGDIPHRAARDLVAYEAAIAEVSRLPPPKTPAASILDDSPATISSRIRIVVFGGDLVDMVPALRAGRQAIPRPKRGWAVIHRGPGGEVIAAEIDRETGWFVESFREPATPASIIEDDEDRTRFEALVRDGILVRV